MAQKTNLSKALSLISSTTAKIELLKAQIADLEAYMEPVKSKVMKYMDTTETKKLENEGWIFTYTPKHTQKRLDTALLKENYEEVYNECLKENDVKETLRAKVDPKAYIENIKNN